MATQPQTGPKTKLSVPVAVPEWTHPSHRTLTLREMTPWTPTQKLQTPRQYRPPLAKQTKIVREGQVHAAVGERKNQAPVQPYKPAVFEL